MTSQQQPHPLRCDNVTCYSTVLFELQELLQYINPDSPAGKIIARRYNELWELRKGCASHSAAAEPPAPIDGPCLMRQAEMQELLEKARAEGAKSERERVIGELERLASEEEQLKKESKTNEPWMGHAYANSAYLKAIAILREGAK